MTRRAEALDGIAEIEVDRQSASPDAASFVADLLGVARGHVARHQVAEARVLALQEVIALGLGDLARARACRPSSGTQTRPSLRSDFAHQGELGLVVARDRNAGRVDLREAGIGEERAALVRAPDGGGVAALGVGREIEDVAVAAGAEHHGVGDVRFDLAGDQVARDDAARLAVDDDQVEHLGAREHLHRARRRSAARAPGRRRAAAAGRSGRARRTCATPARRRSERLSR